MLIPRDGRFTTLCGSSVFDKAVVQIELIGPAAIVTSAASKQV